MSTTKSPATIRSFGVKLIYGAPLQNFFPIFEAIYVYDFRSLALYYFDVCLDFESSSSSSSSWLDVQFETWCCWSWTDLKRLALPIWLLLLLLIIIIIKYVPFGPNLQITIKQTECLKYLQVRSEIELVWVPGLSGFWDNQHHQHWAGLAFPNYIRPF